MENKVIIFDKDGTLLDFDACWVPVAELATQKMLRALGREDIPAGEILAALGVEDGAASIIGELCCGTYPRMAKVIAGVLAQYDCCPEGLEALTAETYESSLSAGSVQPACADIAGVLGQLKARGFKLAVVTTDHQEITAQCLQQLGIAHCFDDVFIGDGGYPIKPDPFCIHALMEKYGVEQGQVVMVGDTLTDLEFAENGGIRAIGLAKTAGNEAILRARTDTVVPDISYLNDIL